MGGAMQGKLEGTALPRKPQVNRLKITINVTRYAIGYMLTIRYQRWAVIFIRTVVAIRLSITHEPPGDARAVTSGAVTNGAVKIITATRGAFY